MRGQFAGVPWRGLSIKDLIMLFKGLCWLLRLLQLTIGLAGYLFTALILGERLGIGLQPFSAMFLAFVFGALSLAVHEGGHYLGARCSGMTVLLVRVLAVELQPQRRGFRLRWSPQAKGGPIAGYVMAAHAPQQPMRRSMLVITLMGPLCNLLVAGLCLALYWPLAGKLAAALLALAVSNLAVGLANLVPTFAPAVSDGTVLLAWLGKPDEQGPALANARLLAQTVAGTQAQDLDTGDLQCLAAEAMPLALIGLGYRLFARQNQGDWQGALALDAELQGLLATAPAPALKHSLVLLAILRGELLFCRAMLARDASGLHDAVFSDETDWFNASFKPRCLALRAALAGDSTTMAACLEQAQRVARNSLERSQGPREEALAGYVQALLMAPAGQGAAACAGSSESRWRHTVCESPKPAADAAEC